MNCSNPKTKPGGAGPLGWLDSGDSPFFQSINFHNLTAGFIQPRHATCGVCAGRFGGREWIPLHTYTFAMCMLWLMRYFSNENTQSRLHISDQCKTWGKMHAPGEDRTHDLQISLWSYWIMRLTRCLLRYRGRQPARALWHGQCLADGEIPPDTLWWMEFFFVIDCLPIIPLVSTNPFPNPIHRPVLNTSWNKCWKYDVLHAKQYFVC